MVQLHAVTSHGIVPLVGLAVAEGGLVATTADGLTGLRSIDMIGTRRPPSSVPRWSASTSDSDLALVSVPDDLPVAPFADDGALNDGSRDYDTEHGRAERHHHDTALHAGGGDRVGSGHHRRAGQTACPPSPRRRRASPRSPATRCSTQDGAVIGHPLRRSEHDPHVPAHATGARRGGRPALDRSSGARLARRRRGRHAPGVDRRQGGRCSCAGSPAAGLLHPGEIVTGDRLGARSVAWPTCGPGST